MIGVGIALLLFTNTPALALEVIEVLPGSAAAGQDIYIVGDENFEAGSSVEIGGVPAPSSFVHDMVPPYLPPFILATVPRGVIGPVPVTVWGPDGSLAASYAEGFSVLVGKGDVEIDGELDAADVLALGRALKGNRALGGDEISAADVAPVVDGSALGDSVVDEADLSVLIRGLSGWDVDGDGLSPQFERPLALSPFQQDTDGDGISDQDEDADGDGLTNLDELALGTGALDPSGIGEADPSYVPSVTTPTYDASTRPSVLFYHARPSELLESGRLDPLKELLLADGYDPQEFTADPIDIPIDSVFACSLSGDYDNCVEWLETLISLDVMIIVEPDEPLSAAEVASFLDFGASWRQMSILVIAESDENLENLTDSLGASFTGGAVMQTAASCPDDGPNDCPLGWTTFRTSDGSLDASHPASSGGNASEAVSAVTTFLAPAFDTPPERFMPDPRLLAEYDDVLRLGPGSTWRGGRETLSAAGLLQGLAIQSPPDARFVAPFRAFLSSDLEAFTALSDPVGGERGLGATSPETNEQFVLNLLHWLDNLIDPLALGPCQGSNGVTCTSQMGDLSYEPEVPDPVYAPAQGPLVLVDSSHNNLSHLNYRYEGFGKLLERDGYRPTDSPNRFDTVSLQEQLAEPGTILVIVNPRQVISEAEAEVVFDWINEGGELFLILDHNPYPTYAATLAERLEVEWANHSNDFDYAGVKLFPPTCVPFGPCELTHLVFSVEEFSVAEGVLSPGHEIVEGRSSLENVGYLRNFYGSAFRPTENASSVGVHVPLATHSPLARWFTPNHLPHSAEGWLRGMTIELGEGRVYVAGEAAAFTAQALKERNGKYYGKIGLQSEPYNEQYLLNVMHWLDGTLGP